MAPTPDSICTVKGLNIEATAGAAVPNVENGYLIDWEGGSLYLEPHGVLDPKLASRPVDTVITPVIDLGLPLAGDFITGASVLPDLIQHFSPRKVLASTTGGGVTFSGLINALLSGAEIKEQPDPRVVTPVPGEPVQLETHAENSERFNAAKP